MGRRNNILLEDLSQGWTDGQTGKQANIDKEVDRHNRFKHKQRQNRFSDRQRDRRDSGTDRETEQIQGQTENPL